MIVLTESERNRLCHFLGDSLGKKMAAHMEGKQQPSEKPEKSKKPKKEQGRSR